VSLIGIVAVAVFNPIASVMQARFETMENRVLRGSGDQLTLYESTQGITSVRNTVAQHFGLTPNQVKVVAHFTGGGFGSKIQVYAEEALMGLGDIQTRTSLSNPAQIIDEYQGGINAFLDTSKRIKGIGTGYLKLDEMTGGLREGELVILAARPAMGKTAFALNIAQHVAMNSRSPKAVAVFSLEMSKEQIGLRILSSESGVSNHLIRAGMLSERNWRDLADASVPMP